MAKKYVLSSTTMRFATVLKLTHTHRSVLEDLKWRGMARRPWCLGHIPNSVLHIPHPQAQMIGTIHASQNCKEIKSTLDGIYNGADHEPHNFG